MWDSAIACAILRVVRSSAVLFCETKCYVQLHFVLWWYCEGILIYFKASYNALTCMCCRFAIPGRYPRHINYHQRHKRKISTLFKSFLFFRTKKLNKKLHMWNTLANIANKTIHYYYFLKGNYIRSSLYSKYYRLCWRIIGH